MPEAENDLPKRRPTKPPPMTQQEFVDELTALVNRAKEAGLRPLPVIARLYAQQGLGILDTWLATLEESTPKTKKVKK